MEMPRPGEETARRFERLADRFDDRAQRGQMFGMPVLKVGGKVFAGTFGDAPGRAWRSRPSRTRPSRRAGRGAPTAGR